MSDSTPVEVRTSTRLKAKATTARSYAARQAPSTFQTFKVDSGPPKKRQKTQRKIAAKPGSSSKPPAKRTQAIQTTPPLATEHTLPNHPAPPINQIQSNYPPSTAYPQYPIYYSSAPYPYPYPHPYSQLPQYPYPAPPHQTSYTYTTQYDPQYSAPQPQPQMITYAYATPPATGASLPSHTPAPIVASPPVPAPARAPAVVPAPVLASSSLFTHKPTPATIPTPAPAPIPAPPAQPPKALWVLAREAREREYARRSQIARLIPVLRRSLPVYLQAIDPLYKGPHGRWKKIRPTVLDSPFPDIVDIFDWPVFQEIMKRDVDAEVIREELVRRKDEILGIMGEWRVGMEAELARIVREGHAAEEGAAEASTSGGSALPDVLPAVTITIGPSQADASQPGTSQSAPASSPTGAALSTLSPDAQFLLRANSILETGRGPCTYPKDLRALQIDWHYPGPWGSPITGSIRYDAQAGKFARRMLRELGRPGALDAEMCAVGERFLCGRCDEYVWPVEWSEIVLHHMDQEDNWIETLKKYPGVETNASGIAYANLHDLARPEPLVILVGREEQKKLFRGDEHHVGILMRCKLCKTLGIQYTNWGEPQLQFHVKNVHRIEEPKLDEHFEFYSGGL